MSPFSKRGERPFSEVELLRVTLSSIGDGVVTTDRHGKVTMLNPVAQELTGWTQEQAVSRDLTEVFRIVNQDTRATVDNPAIRALQQGVIVGLANHTILIARDGTERNIDDSAAPIRDRDGTVGGAVLVFRDITERYKQERTIAESLAYAHAILATMRNGLIVLDVDLRVKTANASFYKTFKVSEQETIGRPIYDLGEGCWDIPRLRTMLEKILPDDGTMEDFKVERDFDGIGPRIMLLNARRLHNHVRENELILLVVEDITDKRIAERATKDSEELYRRLFESAEDGIIILDNDDGRVIDANPYVLKMTDLDLKDLRGKEMWEIGLFQNADESRRAHAELKAKGYIRYDHLPVRNHRTGNLTPAEFVCNVYKEGDRTVAQCNVRDISLRTQLDKANVRAEVMAEEGRRKDEFSPCSATNFATRWLQSVRRCISCARASGLGARTSSRNRPTRSLSDRSRISPRLSATSSKSHVSLPATSG